MSPVYDFDHQADIWVLQVLSASVKAVHWRELLVVPLVALTVVWEGLIQEQQEGVHMVQVEVGLWGQHKIPAVGTSEAELHGCKAPGDPVDHVVGQEAASYVHTALEETLDLAEAHEIGEVHIDLGLSVVEGLDSGVAK